MTEVDLSSGKGRTIRNVEKKVDPAEEDWHALLLTSPHRRMVMRPSAGRLATRLRDFATNRHE